MTENLPIPAADFEALEGLDGLEAGGDLGAEGPDTSGGWPSFDELWDRLYGAIRSTSPDRDLKEIYEDGKFALDPEYGGWPRIQRGVEKMTGAYLDEAWADLLIGVLEAYFGAPLADKRDQEFDGETPIDGEPLEPWQNPDGRYPDFRS